MVMLAQMIEHGESGGDRRASPRRALRLAGDLPAGGGMQGVIHDLSQTGVPLETSAALAPGETFQVELPETGSVAASVVWNSGEFYGCQFARPISPAALSATLLKSP